MAVKLEISDLETMSQHQLNKIAHFLFTFDTPPSQKEDEINEIYTAGVLPLTSSEIEKSEAIKDQQTIAEFDINGLPWDARIHSREKTKTKNGAWKIRRSVEPDFVKQIENEIRAKGFVKTEMPKPTISIPPPIVEPTIPLLTMVPPPPPVEAVKVYEIASYPEFMKHTTGLIQSGKLTSPKFIEIIKSFGFESPATIPERLDLLPAIQQAINFHVGE